MKAFIVKIELRDSNPLIWRRVIMPAGATFSRLHDVIQRVTKFQSGYPGGNHHLYEFDLKAENIRVTNDEEAYEEHRYFMKNQRAYQKRLMNMRPEDAQFERAYQDSLQIKVRRPTMKIDDYIEKHREIRQFSIQLETDSGIMRSTIVWSELCTARGERLCTSITRC